MRLVLCLLLSVAAPASWATAEICHLGDWAKAYGAASPIAAYGKNSPFPIVPRLLRQVAQPKVALRPHDLAVYGFGARIFKDVRKAINISWSRQEGSDERAHAIRQNLKSFFAAPSSTKAGNDTLSLAFVGLYHAVDLFIAAPELRLTFTSIPFTLETKTMEPNFREIVTLLKTPQAEQPADVADNAYVYMLMPYLFARQAVLDMKRNAVPAPPVSTKPRSIVLSDLHGMASVDWIARLPGAACLRAAGIQHLRIGLEGYRTDQVVTPADVIYRRTWLEQATNAARKNQISTEQMLRRVFPEDLVGRILRGEASDNPSELMLARKLVDYAKAGLTVEIHGLEDPSFDDLVN